MSTNRLAAAALLIASPAFAQTTDNPFPEPITASDGVIIVGFEEFASLPDIDGAPARPMLLVDEPGGVVVGLSPNVLTVGDGSGPIQEAVQVQHDGCDHDTDDQALHGLPLPSGVR